MGADRQQAVGGEDLRGTGQHGFAGAGRRQDEGLARVAGLQRHGQRPAYRAQFTGKRKFTGKLVVGQRLGRDLAAGSENAECNRQIEATGLLGQVGRCQIGGDALLGKFEAGIDDGGPHPVAGFLDFGIGQADQGKSGQAAGEVHLDPHRRRVQAVEPAAVRDGESHER